VSSGVVIVGAGQAGITAAVTLRDRGYGGLVTVLGAEDELPYERPPLSKNYLYADPSASLDLAFRPEQYYTDRGITLRLGCTVTAIDRAGRQLSLDDGSAMPYTDLILATGTSPIVPPIPGADLGGVHMLRSLADARALRQELRHARHLTSIGGGFIGLELASAASRLGLESCVLDIADRVLQRAVSTTTSDYLTATHRQRGTRVQLSTGLAEIVGDDRVRAVVATGGERIRTDLVVIAVGVRPNTRLAQEAGLEVANGIVVDEHLRTPDPSIFAIGDCANFPDGFSGLRIRLESVQAATDHARLVAAQITGEDPGPYRSVPWFWSHQSTTKLQIAGYTSCSDEDIVRGDLESGRFSIFRYDRGRLRAVESINRPADHVNARRLLAAEVSPTPDDIASAADLRSLLPVAARV
jgi:3-phenylpropionate/trans-cinnamate dioxygenase ferredoxin reductase subunit